MDMRILPDLSDGILIAAPACQGHSQCGQPAAAGTGGNGQPDARTLRSRHQADLNTAWAVLAACDTARPRAIIVENVPDFLRWPLFDSWRRCIEDMGYAVTTRVIDARSFGSPQARARMILIGSTSGPVDLDVPGIENGGTIESCLDPDDHPGNRWRDLAARSARMVPLMRKAQAAAGARCVWNNVTESTGRPLDGPWPTVTTKSGSQMYLLDGDRCRIVNPRELARAQSIPDSYLIPNHRDLAGKLIGNAIDVRMARAVVAQVVAHAW